MLKFTKKTPQNTELASLIGKTEGAIRRYKKEDEAEYNKVLKKYIRLETFSDLIY